VRADTAGWPQRRGVCVCVCVWGGGGGGHRPTPPQRRHCCRALAQRAANTRKFKIFVVVRNPALATAITSYNKIRLLEPAPGASFAMNKKDAKELALVLAQLHDIPKERHCMFVQDAEIAKTPGFIVKNAHAYKRFSAPASGCAVDLSGASVDRTGIVVSLRLISLRNRRSKCVQPEQFACLQFHPSLRPA